MAFSLRKMLSNITYFTKPGEEENPELSLPDVFSNEKNSKDFCLPSDNIEFDRVEADSTSKSALKLPESVKNYAAKKGSLSDTDLLSITVDSKKQSRKLKLDIKKASQSMNESMNLSEDSSLNVENTPKHKLLDCRSADFFKGFNFNQSFDISDVSSEDEIDIESLTDHSDTDLSENNEKMDIKMCRKVENEIVPSTTPESFADVEVDKNEEERITLLLNYQMKIEKLECFLKKLLTEFQFHIEVSKIFNCKSIVTTLPGTDVTNIPKTLGDITYIDNIQRGISPSGWNIVMEKEDYETKKKLKTQLETMKTGIDEFINTYLQEKKPKLKRLTKSLTFDLHKGKRIHKQNKVSNKKRMKHFDFPDIRDAMLNLFCESDNVTENCLCNCHEITDLTTETNHSISSSIGNFSLDTTQLSAYSESLDQIISYNSFNDSTLFNTLLQKPAIERITFYIQVHSIQLKTDQSKIIFYCLTCKTTDNDENDLLEHILSSDHCVKIHFVYKTEYVKKCIQAGKEIQPSTVLNPMTMYRDDNKIVCFGDAVYACTLCFENVITGESVLMAHCAEPMHVSRKEMMYDMY